MTMAMPTLFPSYPFLHLPESTARLHFPGFLAVRLGPRD